MFEQYHRTLLFFSFSQSHNNHIFSHNHSTMKRLTLKSVEQKLMEDGNFEEYYVNGIPRKRLTDKGREFGIEAEKRLSEKGNEYEVFFYGERAQRGIVKRDY